MSRELSEVHTFTKEKIENACMQIAKLKIINGYYVGTFAKQSVEWMNDHSIRVITTHHPER